MTDFVPAFLDSNEVFACHIARRYLMKCGVIAGSYVAQTLLSVPGGVAAHSPAQARGHGSYTFKGRTGESDLRFQSTNRPRQLLRCPDVEEVEPDDLAGQPSLGRQTREDRLFKRTGAGRWQTVDDARRHQRKAGVDVRQLRRVLVEADDAIAGNVRVADFTARVD